MKFIKVNGYIDFDIQKDDDWKENVPLIESIIEEAHLEEYDFFKSEENKIGFNIKITASTYKDCTLQLKMFKAITNNYYKNKLNIIIEMKGESIF